METDCGQGRGLKLSWWQVGVVLVGFLVCAYAVITKESTHQQADIDAISTEVKSHMVNALNRQEKVIAEKLDSIIFFKYKEEHQEQAKYQLERVIAEFKLIKKDVAQVKKQVTDSRIEIVRILTRMEEKSKKGP